MKKLVFFSLTVLFSSGLSAQSERTGYDYEGRAVVAVLPFTGDREPAELFFTAAAAAVAGLDGYSPWNVSAGAVEAAGLRIPTDMPPVRELVPGARFSITGGVYPGNYPGEYYLQLWLWDMSTSSMIYTDDLVYGDINQGLEALPGLVKWLFSHITLRTGESGTAPKGGEETLINAGVRSGFSQRWYQEPENFSPGAQALNFEGGLFAAVFLNSLLSLQTEVIFTFDHLVYRGIDDSGPLGEYVPELANEKYTAYSLMFPLLLKVNFRPPGFRLAPFAGLYAFLPLGRAAYRKNPAGEGESFSWSSAAPLGYTLGIEGAVKFGLGQLLVDFRWGGDFGATNIHDADTSYSRRLLSLSLGYAFGFIEQKKP